MAVIELPQYQRSVKTESSVTPEDVVFTTLPALGMDRMTKGQVEFVICVSALTAQI